MSSQVITTYPEPPTRPAEAGGAPESEGEAGPGKQKNFYRQISGAGDGHTLQTTADFPGPKIVDPIKSEMNGEPNELNLEPIEGDPGAKSSQNNENQEENKHLEPDWQKKIRSLQDQVNIFISR